MTATPLALRCDAVLVCGLGSLGQSCVSVLKGFGVTVYAIDLAVVQYWEIPALPTLLDGFWQGDCRQAQVLEQAHIHACRSILLVTSNDRVNLGAAFAARALNPQIRLIVRSQQENLNGLLGSHLGNFVAFEPTQLTAVAIALAGLRNETQGFFQLEGHLFRINQEWITPTHRWYRNRSIQSLNTRSRRVLHHGGANQPAPHPFYNWEPTAQLDVGDRITYLDLTDQAVTFTENPSPRPVRPRPPAIKALKQMLHRTWQRRSQTERIALFGLALMVGLVGSGALLFRWQYGDLTVQDALNLSLVLILGGYGDIFGDRHIPFALPGWLHLFSLGLTLCGTLFIGILYALLTERVVSARLAFLNPRPSLPTANHVVIIGLERVGQQVATLLYTLRQPCIGVDSALDVGVLPHLPLVTEPLREALLKVNLKNARSVLILTKDEMTNLEIGLMVQAIHPHCPLVLRTADSQFGSHIAQLLPQAKAFSIDALAAEVFAAAAFGENILSLLHLNHQTVLVTEYHIEPGDTLQGRLIAEVAYGYGVVPVLHQRTAPAPETPLPSDDIQLQRGDRLIVLATLEGLQNIELGHIARPTWQVWIEQMMVPNVSFEGIAVMARMTGCELGLAKAVLENLPAPLAVPLYKPQAQRLVQELSKIQIRASSHRIEGFA